MRRISLVVVVAALVGAGGWYVGHAVSRCPGCHTLDAHQATWRSQHLVDYSYVYEEGGMACCDRVRVTVHAGRVTHTEVLHELYPRAKKPTVDDVFSAARHEMHVADGVTVQYDNRYGFPMSVNVDPNDHAMDDEWGFRIEQFRRLTPANA
ncbi:MAG TPA: DUF6174 domain-containing protein [Acidimicrobiia bacterium]|jgi:hypothetical protein|nr:DUF6174 domain-containing protein [Acidimicrobiia bacterium]